MLVTLAYAGTIIVFLLIVFLIVLSVKSYRAATSDRAKIEWALNEMHRALDQINSQDENNIMVGLQTLSTFNDPEIHVRAIGRLAELTHSPNSHVAAQSRAAIARLAAVSCQEAVTEHDSERRHG